MPYFDLIRFLDFLFKAQRNIWKVPPGIFTYSSTEDQPIDQIVDESLMQTSNNIENSITNQILHEDILTNPMLSEKRYKRITE